MTKNKKIVISGYYGFDNAGDEAVLSGILEMFKSLDAGVDITVLSSNPDATKNLHNGVNSVNRFKIVPLIKAISSADLVISGGGSLFQDVTSANSLRYYLFILKIAQFFRKKTMVFAQGVGPLNSENSRNAVSGVLNKVSAISVRDLESKKLLEAVGVNKNEMVLSADPSYYVKPDMEKADDILKDIGLENKPYLAVCIRPWKDNSWFDEFSKGLHDACKAIGVEALAIPMMNSVDSEICGLLNVKSINSDIDFRTVKGLIARSSMVIGMRLHSLIFAADCGVPFVSVVYDPKVSSFSAHFNEMKGIIVEKIKSNIVEEEIVAGWNVRDDLKNKILTNAQEQRELAFSSAKKACELLRGI